LSKRAYLLAEMGIDGFKTDGGEHLAGREIRSSDGRTGSELVNAFPNLYVDAYHQFAKHHRHGDALTFSRAGHTGAGALPAHWAGDENSTWEAFRRSIVAGLTAGLSGIIFWGWDIAGFSGDLPTTELYLRSTAMATFCPIMQYHSEYNPNLPSRDRTPWNVAAQTGDEGVIPVFRFFARLRMNLLPYIAEEAEHAAANGTPLMRPLLLDFPDDPIAWRINDQYCFGRSLLVAPVVDEGATTRDLFLPAGRWIDLWSGEAFDGGRWLTVEVPLDRIPVFAREGARIPLRLGPEKALGADTGNGLSVTEGVVTWIAGASRLDVLESDH
jgi:alpha-glucosidase (family GH31 glycosyl hydrolase)